MKKFKLSVMIVMIGTLVSKVFGLLREILLAQNYGTGYISDAFILSLNIPTVLISAIATAVLTNYIPLYSEAEKESEEKTAKFNGNLFVIFFIITIILTILFLFFTKPIVRVFAVGFDEQGLEYLIILSKITIFSMYFIIASHILKGYLEYKESFIGTSLYGILMNIGIIIGIIFSTTEKYQILGYGVLIGYILSFIVLLILAKLNKLKDKFNLNIKDKYIKKLIVLTIPILLNDVVWQINGIVDKSISSTIGAGYISAINYSHYIVDIVTSIFATSIVTVFFPKIIKMFNEQGVEKVKKEKNNIIKIIILITIPCTILISIFSKTIVKVLFFRGAFDLNSLQITSIAVSIYSLAIVFVSIKTILFKVFYALQDTKSPTTAAVISIICNIILTLILVKPLGYKGIIIATIIASVISTIILYIKFNKKYGKLADKNFWNNIIKIIFGSLIMLISIFIVNNVTNNIYIINEIVSDISKAVIAGIISIPMYLLSLVILKFNFKTNK